MSILISVVICTRDRAALLARALESVCRQSLDPGLYEVVVVDNGSADDTPRVVDRFAAGHANVRGAVERRHGLSQARNRGWTEARGEYVAYMDDDCRAPKGWLAAARGVIDRLAPEVFGGPYFPCYDAPKPAWFRDAYASHDKGGPARLLGKDEYLSGGNIVFRRAVLAEAGGFDGAFGMFGNALGYAEETDLLRRLRETKPGVLVFYDPSVFMYHLVRPEKMTMRWIVRQKYASGLYAQRVFRDSDGTDPGRLRLLARGARILAGFGADLARGLFLRDRVRYPDVRNHLFEVAFVRLQDLGRIRERIRQAGEGRGDAAGFPGRAVLRRKGPAADSPAAWPELGLKDFVRRESCPSCGSPGATPLGGGDGSFVGGRRFVAEALRFGSGLRRARRILACRRCGLLYQEWVPTRELLLRLYGVPGEGKPWPPDPRRLTWSRAMRRLPARPGRILDVGANDGHFLSLLPPGWVRVALEPAGMAREASLARASEERHEGFLDEPLPPAIPRESFDVVCLFDVAEHLRDVGAAMANLAKLLKPGGTALLETGNTRCLPARLLGSRWWYFDYIEHFVFFDRSSLRSVLKTAGLHVEECRRVVHSRTAALPRMAVDLAAAAFRARRLRDGGGPSRKILLDHPLRVYWPDHLFAVVRKPPAGRMTPCG